MAEIYTCRMIKTMTFDIKDETMISGLEENKMPRLTGQDADGCIISTEEYAIIATRAVTPKEEENIKNHILEKLYEYENMEDEIKRLIKRLKKMINRNCTM